VSDDKTGSSALVVGQDITHTGSDTANSGESFETVNSGTPYADNDDPTKVRFVKRGMSKLKRLIKRIGNLFSLFIEYVSDLRSPSLSFDEKLTMLYKLRRWNDEELQIRRHARLEMQIFVTHKQQSKLVRAQIIEVLTNLGFCYSITKNERRYIKRKVKISQVDVNPYAYIFHITQVPFGVKKTEMSQDWVATELCSTLGKKVRHELDPNGLRYTVEVGSTNNIPNFVEFGDPKFAMPEKKPPLLFWAGLSANGGSIYRNLAAAPHIIIAGETGGGKSNIENSIACTFIKNNTPDIVRLVFFDLKGGVEFSHFDGIPHLWKMDDGDKKCDGIIERPGDVMAAVESLNQE